MTQQCEACLALTLEVARLLGRGEAGSASPAEASLLRTLTPLAKLFTAKAAVAVASEGVEFFGGVGYVESSGLPGILRDAQVLPIWEGTTNVLSLDLLRALGADARAGDAFLSEARRRAARAADSAGVRLGDGGGADEGFEESAQLPAGRTAQEVVRCAAATIMAALDALEVTLRSVLRSGPAGDEAQVGARDLAMAMARAFVAGEGCSSYVAVCWALSEAVEEVWKWVGAPRILEGRVLRLGREGDGAELGGRG